MGFHFFSLFLTYLSVEIVHFIISLPLWNSFCSNNSMMMIMCCRRKMKTENHFLKKIKIKFNKKNKKFKKTHNWQCMKTQQQPMKMKWPHQFEQSNIEWMNILEFLENFFCYSFKKKKKFPPDFNEWMNGMKCAIIFIFIRFRPSW